MSATREQATENLEKAHAAKRCEAHRVDGTQCGSPSMGLGHYCYYHFHFVDLSDGFLLPPLEDGEAIQVALTSLGKAIQEKRVDSATSGRILWLLQTAALNLRNTRQQPALHLERQIALVKLRADAQLAAELAKMKAAAELQLQNQLALLEARAAHAEKLLRLRNELIAERQRANAEHRAALASASAEQREQKGREEILQDLEYEILMRRLEWLGSDDWDGTTDPPVGWRPAPDPEDDAPPRKPPVAAPGHATVSPQVQSISPG